MTFIGESSSTVTNFDNEVGTRALILEPKNRSGITFRGSDATRTDAICKRVGAISGRRPRSLHVRHPLGLFPRSRRQALSIYRSPPHSERIGQQRRGKNGDPKGREKEEECKDQMRGGDLTRNVAGTFPSIPDVLYPRFIRESASDLPVRD